MEGPFGIRKVSADRERESRRPWPEWRGQKRIDHPSIENRRSGSASTRTKSFQWQMGNRDRVECPMSLWFENAETLFPRLFATYRTFRIHRSSHPKAAILLETVSLGTGLKSAVSRSNENTVSCSIQRW